MEDSCPSERREGLLPMPHHTSPSGGEASPNSHLRSTSALTADMTSQMKKAPPSPRPKRRIRPELVSSTSVESNSSSADVFAKANAAASPPAALAAADHSRKRKRDVDTKEDQEGDSLPSSSESAHHAASFVFDPSAAPSESARAASAAVVQERIAQFLSGSEPVHATTAAQRNRMSKDLLLQRNIEIQGEGARERLPGRALPPPCCAFSDRPLTVRVVPTLPRPPPMSQPPCSRLIVSMIVC